MPKQLKVELTEESPGHWKINVLEVDNREVKRCIPAIGQICSETAGQAVDELMNICFMFAR